MSPGYARNAELSRAAILLAAGGSLIGMAQNIPELTQGLGGKIAFVIGAVLVIGGLVATVRTLTRRRGGADQ